MEGINSSEPLKVQKTIYHMILVDKQTTIWVVAESVRRRIKKNHVQAIVCFGVGWRG